MKRVLAVAAVLLIIVGIALSIPSEKSVERTRTLAAPMAAVHAQLSDFRKWDVWMVTSRADRVMGTSSFEEDGRLWRWKTKNGQSQGVRRTSLTADRLELELVDGAKMAQTVTLAPDGAGTRVTWQHRVTLRGPAKLAPLIMSPEQVLGPMLEEWLAALEKASMADPAAR